MITHIATLIALFVALALLSFGQAVIARAALTDTELDVPGWRWLLLLWAGTQSTILFITFTAGRLL